MMDYFYGSVIKPDYERRLAAGGRKQAALYDALRAAIAGGALREGDRLPSTRRLAAWLDLSRGSVGGVYDNLIAEGYARSAAGSGTYVAYRPPAVAPAPAAGTRLRLSAWGERLPAAGPAPTAEAARRDRHRPAGFALDMTIGRNDPSIFPAAAWKRALYAEIRGFADRQHEDAFRPEGHEPLRRAIALLAMLLLDAGDRAVIENPGYEGMLRAVRTAGGCPLTGAVDREGLVPEDWPARLLFATPNRQFPTGVVMPRERRAALLEWAERREAIIVEDDYDSEFRWGARAVEPLKTMDAAGRVVYIGSFSKTMLTDLRLGYVVLPQPLVEPIRRAKYGMEPHPSGLAEQRALARFMASGEYGRHLRRMKRLYGRRLVFLRERLQRRLGSLFELYPSEAGLHLYARWRGSPDRYERLRAACAAAGIRWSDGAAYWRSAPPHPAALFGFAGLDEARLGEAVDRMGEIAEGRS